MLEACSRNRRGANQGAAPIKAVVEFFGVAVAGEYVEAERTGHRKRLHPACTIGEVAEPLPDLKGRCENCLRKRPDPLRPDAPRRDVQGYSTSQLAHWGSEKIVPKANGRIREAIGRSG